jgi:hypothetical protein
MTMKNTVSWDVTTCSSSVKRRFGETYRPPKDGGGTFLRNVVSHYNYTGPQPRRRHSSSTLTFRKTGKLVPDQTLSHARTKLFHKPRSEDLKFFNSTGLLVQKFEECRYEVHDSLVNFSALSLHFIILISLP